MKHRLSQAMVSAMKTHSKVKGGGDFREGRREDLP